MNDQEANREARKQRTLERLGTPTPRCVNCGCNEWRCLEAHHIAGRKFDDATVILCRNCHRVVTDDLRDNPSPLGGQPTICERAGNFLKGLAALFALLVRKLHEFGDALLELASQESAAAAAGAS